MFVFVVVVVNVVVVVVGVVYFAVGTFTNLLFLSDLMPLSFSTNPDSPRKF
jgi:hypothetical protein